MLSAATTTEANVKLNGKVAVITGGSSGIGLAIARRFVEAEAHVFIMGRRQTELDEAAKTIGVNVTAIQGDVTKASDLERMQGRVKEEKGRIDVLVCSAGGGGFTPLGSVTRDAFHETFMLNAGGVVIP